MRRFPVAQKTREGIRAPGPLHYLIAANGIFQVRETAIYRAVTRVEGVPGLLPAREELELRIPPLPAALQEEMLAFFRDAHRRYGGEAMCLLFYREETREFRAEAPPQTIPAYRDRQGVLRATQRLEYGHVERPRGFVLLGTAHSHGALAAYASSVDCMDEQHADGLHVVYGHVESEHPSRFACFVANRVRFPLAAASVLEPCRPPRRAARADWMARLRLEEETPAHATRWSPALVPAHSWRRES